MRLNRQDSGEPSQRNIASSSSIENFEGSVMCYLVKSGPNNRVISNSELRHVLFSSSVTCLLKRRSGCEHSGKVQHASVPTLCFCLYNGTPAKDFIVYPIENLLFSDAHVHETSSHAGSLEVEFESVTLVLHHILDALETVVTIHTFRNVYHRVT